MFASNQNDNMSYYNGLSKPLWINQTLKGIDNFEIKNSNLK